MEYDGIVADLNQNSPISRLVPDILIDIFQRVHNLHMNEWNPRNYGLLDISHGRIALTRVCRRWRSISLNMPSLWRNITFSTPGWTQEMLLRSRPLSVDIHFNSDCHRDYGPGKRDLSELNALAVESISRARKLRLVDKVVDVIILSVTPAPLLEELHLSRLYPHLRHATRIVPPSIFDGKAPRLQKLFLHELTIHPASPILFGLTFLEIRNGAGAAHHPLSEWLHALMYMPQLEHLHLGHALSPGSQDPNFPMVTLSHLKTLGLGVLALSDCIEFTNHISIPSATFVEVNIIEIQMNRPTPRNMIPSYAERPIKALRITFMECGFSVDGELDDSSSLKISVIDYGDLMSEAAANNILPTLAHFNVRFVHDLTIHISELRLDWSPILSRFPSVNTLHVTGTSLDIFAIALAHSTSAGPVCPSLRRLGFQYEMPEIYDEHIIHKDFFNILQRVVDTRKANGAVLEELIVFGEAVPQSEGAVDTTALGLRKVPDDYFFNRDRESLSDRALLVEDIATESASL
ncbi:hypothetical protein HETIRDRAFT_326455 [Heterobasidion irregulare TC 32-1]|uniref:Uncharacterized protein n=1 Tax=Heterobasidion irregulare (strain TC 32-1) TaxID=747525 RepID=W4JWH4_HETIT|nr:uncharacterized protein HETIRDRAFT_326455 [Heterobasidion irregulare TC 32-1]ETW77236.1 hypothetical protein HETIRDRAFT_326455 [Heterobasidion irregulare TC 32-1]